MRLLTKQHIDDAFSNWDQDVTDVGQFLVVLKLAESDGGIELRQALEIVRRRRREVAVFIERILQPSDLDEAVFVIDLLTKDLSEFDSWDDMCLTLLQAWRARVLMQIIIEKRNVMNRPQHGRDEDESCD
jgi:hypothetical protein